MINAKDLVADANKEIQTLSAEEALKLVEKSQAVFVDVREGEEVKMTGKIKGAVNAPRGFLEFMVDPTSPTHKPQLSGGKKLLLYCSSGNRSALATKSLKDMGIKNVAHVAGGFAALQSAAAPIEDHY